MIKTPWRKYSDVMYESVENISERKKGKIKPIITSWNQFNNLNSGGVEWGIIVTILSRPGIGKSLILGQISREIIPLNKEQDFNILQFQFEMHGMMLAAREFTSASKIPLIDLYSKGGKPLDEDILHRLKRYVQKQEYRNDYIIDKSMSVMQMADTLDNFWLKHKKPFVCTIDHATLVKKSASDKTEKDTIDNLYYMLMEKKKKYPCMFLVLAHLNRTIESAERQKPGNLANYPCDNDIYGSDGLQKCSDIQLAFNKPSKYSLGLYGPHKYILTEADKNLLACHVLKDRNGHEGGKIHWYEALYNEMKIVERDAPPKRM